MGMHVGRCPRSFEILVSMSDQRFGLGGRMWAPVVRSLARSCWRDVRLDVVSDVDTRQCGEECLNGQPSELCGVFPALHSRDLPALGWSCAGGACDVEGAVRFREGPQVNACGCLPENDRKTALIQDIEVQWIMERRERIRPTTTGMKSCPSLPPRLPTVHDPVVLLGHSRLAECPLHATCKVRSTRCRVVRFRSLLITRIAGSVSNFSNRRRHRRMHADPSDSCTLQGGGVVIGAIVLFAILCICQRRRVPKTSRF
jgi:hypothetical protein